jgi:hypothetical protein
MLPRPITAAYIRRDWLQPTAADPGEIVCALIVKREKRWLRARVHQSGAVHFAEIPPRSDPRHWGPAQQAVVAQAERALSEQMVVTRHWTALLLRVLREQAVHVHNEAVASTDR